MSKAGTESIMNMPERSDHPPVRASQEIAYCEEKTRLMNEFLRTIHELGVLQTQQAKALIEGDPDFARFDLLIYMANERKDQVKYAWFTHIEKHRC